MIWHHPELESGTLPPPPWRQGGRWHARTSPLSPSMLTGSDAVTRGPVSSTLSEESVPIVQKLPSWTQGRGRSSHAFKYPVKALWK